MTICQLAHREYLRSASWRDIRERILQRDGNACRQCGNPASDVHHKHYRNWGNEKDADLVSLCRPCHELTHKKPFPNSRAIGTKAIWGHLSESQKASLEARFSVSANHLYTLICGDCDITVTNAAASLLGYKYWYPQHRKPNKAKARTEAFSKYRPKLVDNQFQPMTGDAATSTSPGKDRTGLTPTAQAAAPQRITAQVQNTVSLPTTMDNGAESLRPRPSVALTSQL
jgi:hypothetical protein